MDLSDRGRRAVCRRCHCVCDDLEPLDKNGEYYHPAKLKDGTTPRKCPNAGRTFYLHYEKDAKEIEPFVRKAQRRANKRHGVREAKEVNPFARKGLPIRSR